MTAKNFKVSIMRRAGDLENVSGEFERLALGGFENKVLRVRIYPDADQLHYLLAGKHVTIPAAQWSIF